MLKKTEAEKTEIISLMEELLFTVIRIDVMRNNGERSMGTGFIFDYEVGDKKYLFLVTNKHVVSDAKEGWLTFVRGDEQKPLLGEAYQLRIEDLGSTFIGHKSSAIDVVVSPFVPILNYISNQNVQIFFRAIPNRLIPNEEALKGLDAVEEVLFVGYPIGLRDPRNLIPIVRRGITATPPYLDFMGDKQFLIDASVFPGSSGSPVCIYNAGIYSDKRSRRTIAGNRILFLGILSAAFRMPDTGEIVISAERMPHVRINQLVDLGVVFRAETIVETIEDFLRSRENAKSSAASG